ncbi:hypothetical protein Sbal625DRAFT_3768 [Shewanella baltica OS625]|nr:hypothetical protein Sbal678_0546 [Shewanella baltica OS678]EHC04489.1 hypothetical protein Sbal625DRAFT_3768 [Shewanella baltica OS625]
MNQKANLWFAFCFYHFVSINTANASAFLLHCFASLFLSLIYQQLG